MEFVAMVRMLDKLLDYTASGIGAVAGPMLAPWKARREAEARRIASRGDADTLRIITGAQVEAREALASTSINVQGEINIAEIVQQRLQFQEEKRQRNIGSIVGRIAEQLGDKEVPDKEPDHDWTARFFNYIQDVSSEEMQVLWAKVLAGEIEHPGSVSIRGLSILRNLDQASAKLFQTLCSCCITYMIGNEEMLDARVPSLGGSAGGNSLQKFGLNFNNLNILNEHGLIISDYNSWYDYRMSIGLLTRFDNKQTHIIRIPFKFQKRYWILAPSSERETNSELRISGVALTQAGKELFKIIECKEMPDYHQALADFFATQNLVMTEVSSREPHIVNMGVH